MISALIASSSCASIVLTSDFTNSKVFSSPVCNCINSDLRIPVFAISEQIAFNRLFHFCSNPESSDTF